jgi:transcriptional regulator with XRE-family HTH domain
VVIKEVRRENLEALIASHGSIRALADAAGANAAHISQIRNGIRSMGDSFARALERELGLEHGWLDSPQKASPERDLVMVPPLGVIHEGSALAGVAISRAWLERQAPGSKVVDLRHVSIIEKGPVEPLREGDLAVIDTGAKAVSVDGLYYLTAATGLVLRAARTLIDGSVYLATPSPGAIPEKVAKKELRKLEVIGRVIGLVRLVPV